MAVALRSCVFIVMACVLLSQNAWSQQAVGLRSSILLASPVMAIGDIDSSWQGPSSGNYAQARAVIESYFQVNQHWALGVERRWHYLLAFSEDTAQFYSRLENNNIENGDYDLSLSINAASSDGVFAQYFIPLSSYANFWVKVHLLKGSRMQDGDLVGSGEVSDSNLAYDWQLDYAYDENRIFESPRKHASAWGYSFDLNMQVRLNDAQRIVLSLEDVLYSLHWQAIDQDEGCLNRPLTSNCSVYTSRSSYVQQFPVFAKLHWQYHFDELKTTLEAQAWQRYRALILGVDYGGMQLEVDGINEMLNLGYESSRLKVKWGFDKIYISQAKHWQLTLDMNWPIL
ncbi:MAG: hypothetical protein ACI8SR_003221 [Oceanicoccus sp.]